MSHEQEVGAGPDEVMPVVVRHLTDMLASLGRTADDVRGVGMSLAGVVDADRVMSADSPALAGWDGVPLAPYVRQVTSAPVFLDTDCNVMALSRLRVAPTTLSEHDDALVLKASTGIGLGLVADGRIVRGHRGAAGRSATSRSPRPPDCRAAAATSGAWRPWRAAGRWRTRTSATWSPRPSGATVAPARWCASRDATSARPSPRS